MDFLENEELDSGSDIDREIAAAAEILEKTAADQNVDLNQFSEEQIGELIAGIINEGETKVASYDHTPEVADYPEVTHQDVSFELAKVASANGIDLSQISREDYEAAYNEMATQLTDPDLYAQKVAAEEEYTQKMAEADQAGRVMAHAFADELGLSKEAKAGVILDSAGNVIKSTLKQRAAHTAPAQAVAKATHSAGGRAKKIKDSVMKGIYGAQYGAGRAASSVDKKVQNLGATIVGKNRGSNALSPATKRTVGYGTVGAGTLAVGGAGYGASKAMNKKSSEEEFEEAALEIAQEYLNKLASENAVYERAAEILAENGIEI